MKKLIISRYVHTHTHIHLYTLLEVVTHKHLHSVIICSVFGYLNIQEFVVNITAATQTYDTEN